MAHSVAPSSIESSASAPQARSRRPLVLVIDPDESTRSVLEVAMARDGFEVLGAGSGREGLAHLQGRAPDAIVLESDLGGEEGFSFVAQLRGTDALSRVPVLLLAKADDENVEALADVVGVDDFIQKPAFARDVAALVRVELARARGGAMRFNSKLLPPVQLLRALLSCPRSGRILLHGGRAELRFRTGKVLDARFDGRGGSLDVLVRALALTSGEYELVLEAVDGFAELQCTLREVVELVAPRLQKWERVLQRSLPLDARLAVDFARLATGLKAMPDEVNRVVQLFDGHRSVEQVLLDSTFNETLTLEVATRLYLMGVLAPAAGSDADLATLKPMPRLFEPRAAEAEELMQQLFAGTAEIRAVDEAVAQVDQDWFSPSVAKAELEVADPAGGWTTAPVPTLLAEGLAPELARQLDAFKTTMQVEAPQLAPEVAAVRRFAEAPVAEPSETVMEAALREAAGVPQVDDAQLQAQLTEFYAQARGTQARIETPWMTPVVEVPAPASAVEAPPTVEVSAEAAFFNGEAPAPVEDLHVTPQRKRALWPYAAGAVAVAVLAFSADFFRGPAAVEPPPAPAPAPEVVVAPVLPDIAPRELLVAEAPEAPALEAPLDVSENLAEATRLYNAGQYKKAISVLEQVVSDDPSSVLAWNLMGLARYDAHDSAGAKAAAERVLALEPRNARVQILLATLHFDAGERAEGRANLERYLELAPSGLEVAEVRALLQRYR
jgi:DNA-binding response OmpR family regulator/tetratricopeptide (TPR) repeat protein